MDNGKLTMEKRTDVDFFAQYLPKIDADKRCKTCHGRGYTGIVRIPSQDKSLQDQPLLQLCHCASLEDTTLKVLLDNSVLMNDVLQVVVQKLTVIDRHTFGYWIAMASEVVKGKWEMVKGRWKKLLTRRGGE
jgi:RecJ-like exonuclease